MPSVVGVPYDQAVAELERAGLQAVRVEESSDLAEGIVTRQDPSGGSETSRGTTVTLYVSRGPDTTAVPDVTATDVAIAQATHKRLALDGSKNIILHFFVERALVTWRFVVAYLTMAVASSVATTTYWGSSG